MIYLDNAATSFPKAPGVAEAVAACIRDLPGSPGRASHAFAVAASELMYSVRERLAGLFGIDRPERLVFTKNATEALSLAIMGYLGPRIGARVIASPFEHNSVMRPLRRLEDRQRLRERVPARIPARPLRGGHPEPRGPGGSRRCPRVARMPRPRIHRREREKTKGAPYRRAPLHPGPLGASLRR